MYTGDFSIFILDSNDKAEKILSQLPAMEDCEFEFSTVLKLGELPKNDSAVIVFGGAERLEEALKSKPSFVATVVTGATAQNVLDKFPQSVSDTDIWVMPENDIYNEKLLTRYFKRLAVRMKNAFDYRRLNICVDTAFDSIPDLVWFKDIEGSHLKVNDGFCRAVEKTKEQIYKRGHYYIWDIPKEEYEQGEYVCLESEEVVMQAKKTLLFDEKVKTKHGMGQFKTYKSPLIDEDGRIFGTCGIAHDVTDLHNTQHELRVVLESMPFGVIVSDKTGKIVTINSKLTELAPNITDIIGKQYPEWKAKSLSDAKPYIYGGERLSRNLMGQDYEIWIREVTLQNMFEQNIGMITLFSDITTEQEDARRTEQRANTDFLTGLNNRRRLFDYLGALEKVQKLYFVTIDLDNFKKVNDNYGHHVGDEALVATAQAMRRTFPIDFIARLGGDEFLVVVSRNVSVSEVETATQRLLDELKQAYTATEQFNVMTASAGIAVSELDNKEKHDVEQLLRHSDKALYLAKNSGRDKYCLYEA